jgi:3-phenylpropionate/trans-cinnamate dioxygenase ferredoxin component
MSELATVPFRTLDVPYSIPDDSVVPVYLQDRKLRIAVARVAGQLYAFDDLCTCSSEHCPLSGGLLAGTTITCQCHGSQFDIATGVVVRGPATDALSVYEAREAGGGVEVRA